MEKIRNVFALRIRNVLVDRTYISKIIRLRSSLILVSFVETSLPLRPRFPNYLKVSYTYRSIGSGDCMGREKKISLNMNEDLWHKFRLKCMAKKRTATEVLEEFIANYIKN